jgi:hypothetical protein
MAPSGASAPASADVPAAGARKRAASVAATAATRHAAAPAAADTTTVDAVPADAARAARRARSSSRGAADRGRSPLPAAGSRSRSTSRSAPPSAAPAAQRQRDGAEEQPAAPPVAPGSPPASPPSQPLQPDAGDAGDALRLHRGTCATKLPAHGAALDRRVQALERKAGRAVTRYRWAKQQLRRLSVKCRVLGARCGALEDVLTQGFATAKTDTDKLADTVRADARSYVKQLSKVMEERLADVKSDICALQDRAGAAAPPAAAYSSLPPPQYYASPAYNAAPAAAPPTEASSCPTPRWRW